MAFDPIPLESKSAPATPNAYFRPIPVSGVWGGADVSVTPLDAGEDDLATIVAKINELIAALS